VCKNETLRCKFFATASDCKYTQRLYQVWPTAFFKYQNFFKRMLNHIEFHMLIISFLIFSEFTGMKLPLSPFCANF